MAQSTAALIGAGLGALKGISNNAKNKKDAAYRKAALTYSPWTGMGDPGQPERAGVLGSVLQGGLAGLSAGQSIPGMNAGIDKGLGSLWGAISPTVGGGGGSPVAMTPPKVGLNYKLPTID